MGYTFITDPGHGWLSVPLSDLKRYGLIHEITPYSYMTVTRAYLEEDCDATKFVKAASLDINSIRTTHNNGLAKCRGYHPYDAAYAENFTSWYVGTVDNGDSFGGHYVMRDVTPVPLEFIMR